MSAPPFAMLSGGLWGSAQTLVGTHRQAVPDVDRRDRHERSFSSSTCVPKDVRIALKQQSALHEFRAG